MEFWRSCLQIFQDLTHIIPLPLCWDSIEYLWEARPAPRLVCFSGYAWTQFYQWLFWQDPDTRYIRYIPDYADIQNILAHKKNACSL